MTERRKKCRILFIDSGSGFGGPAVFLDYLLKYLDREKFQPFVAFYFYHSAPETDYIRRIGIPIFFLSRNREPSNYVPIKFLLGKSKWRWLHEIKVLVRFSVRLALVEIPQLWRLLTILKRKAIALIVLNNDVHGHLVGALAARISRIPCICRKAGGIGEGRRLKRFLTPMVDLFISISAATETDQRENNPSTKRLVTIYDGVDLRRFDPSVDPSPVHAELGVPRGRKVVGLVSRLVPGKGHKELLEAAAVVVKRYPNVVFLIVGGTPYATSEQLREELQAVVQSLQLRDYVIFTGWREDVPRILSAVDIFVHCPTTCIEGLGIANLEAMAMGKPTVVSNNGGLPDAVVDGVTGFVVPPGDIEKLSAAILRLLEDDELARRLGRNARQRIENEFDIEKNTRKLEVFFEEYALR